MLVIWWDWLSNFGLSAKTRTNSPDQLTNLPEDILTVDIMSLGNFIFANFPYEFPVSFSLERCETKLEAT